LRASGGGNTPLASFSIKFYNTNTHYLSFHNSGDITVRRLALMSLILAALIAACSSKDTQYSYSDLPASDAAHGATLFAQSVNEAVACSSCHSVDGTAGAGPTLANFAAEAGGRVSGQSAGEYTFYSLLRPAKFLVSGYSNIMPTNYEEKLSRQDTADLIAYVLTLGGDGSGVAAQSSGGGGKSVDTYMLIFRLIHIFAAAFWFGAGSAMVLFLEPTFKALGPDGQRFTRTFFTASRWSIALPLTAITTTVAGLALFYRVSDHFNADWMGSTPGIVLSIGVVCGLLAFVHGGAVIGPSTSKYVALLKELTQSDAPLSEEQSSLLRRAQMNMALHGRISMVLIVAAMACMISAKYL